MGYAACPAVRTLRTALEAAVPLLTKNYQEWGKNKATGKDVFLPRLQTDGNPRHQSGMCLDIILFCRPGDTNDPEARKNCANEKKLGEHLVQTFIDLRDQMKWTEIIFQDRLFWEPEKYSHYGQDQKHFTHIHIDWVSNGIKGTNETETLIRANSPTSTTDDFGTALTPRLKSLNTQFEAGTLPGIALANIVRKPHAQADATGRWEVRVDKWLWYYTFAADGTVTWLDPFNQETGKGKWREGATTLVFDWSPSKSTESWTLPLAATGQTGVTVMEGKRYEVRATRVASPG